MNDITTMQDIMKLYAFIALLVASVFFIWYFVSEKSFKKLVGVPEKVEIPFSEFVVTTLLSAVFWVIYIPLLIISHKFAPKKK